LKKTLHKKRAVAQGEGLEFKPQYHTHTHTHKKKKKEKERKEKEVVSAAGQDPSLLFDWYP
jgi:hypothetical protein